MTTPDDVTTLHPSTDRFIAEILPDWLKGASVEQIRLLREQAAALRTSQQQLQEVLKPLKALDDFAALALESALATRLQISVNLRTAQWRDERRRLEVFQDEVREFSSYYVYTPALQHLMQNFKNNESFYEGTALVHPADPVSGEAERVVSSASGQIAEVCRAVDVGGGYRAHLDSVLDERFITDLADDRRRQLGFEIEVAAIKGQHNAFDLNMLRSAAEGEAVTHSLGQQVLCGPLEMLGCALDGTLTFSIRGTWLGGSSGPAISVPQLMGVVVYMPDDHEQPLRQFPDFTAVNRYLAGKMAQPAFCADVLRRVAIKDRAVFITTLGSRLKDPTPDMQPAVQTIEGDLFVGVARAHVERIKDDAAELAVPTAQADRDATRERVKALEDVGLTVLNLAGLFVPVVGALLLADMVRQTLTQLCEGVEDWSQGHQHEALEHFLGVAETVAVTAAVAAGGTLVANGFARSAFVDELQPVLNAQEQHRLHADDLSPYRTSTSTTGTLQHASDGLLTDGDRRLLQHDGQRYQVRPIPGRSSWQLVHPTRDAAFAPELESNGEQAWLLSHERPLEWQGASTLLARLWPEASALDEARAAQILQVAGVDEEALRGLLVERRPLPVALRDTLQRFAVDARIQALFDQLGTGVAAGIDSELFDWCVEREALGDRPWAEQADHLLDNAPLLGEAMLEQFSRSSLRQDDLLWLIKRDFPGLPDAYAVHLLDHADAAQRLRMSSESRIPLALGQQARQLLLEAKLVRMRESLFLANSYRDETVAVVFNLLRRHANWPATVNLELRDDPSSGRLLAQLFAEPQTDSTVSVMVRREARFALYNAEGQLLERQPAGSAGLADALFAVLPESDRQALGWGTTAQSAGVRADLQRWLPNTRAELLLDAGLSDVGALANPLRRLPDGRFGYLLSGRGQAFGAMLQLRDRVRALYPGFSSEDLDSYVSALMRRPGSAFANLLIQEQQYRRLDTALQTWVNDSSVVSTIMARRRCANEFRRCWRMSGEQELSSIGHVVGMRMTLISSPIEVLPELPADADFSHITSLTLIGLGLDNIPAQFLRLFNRVRMLDLSNNTLNVWPAQLSSMRELRILRLARNQLRMTAASSALLNDFSQLHELDLSYNPLGAISLEFRQLSRLRTLNLRDTGLLTMPSGLEWCGFLETADLRNNSIASMPQLWLDAPASLRQSLRLLGNPLPAGVAAQMRAPAVEELAIPGEVPTLEDARVLWLSGLSEADSERRGPLWDDLQAEPGSAQFMQMMAELTRTSEYRQARAALAERVWGLIEQAHDDAVLRDELFTLAANPRTCVDSVLSCYSVLEVRGMVAKALQDATGAQAEAARLQLARRLFRLDRVERIARDAMASARAQGREVDEIEVSLAYRTGLADELDLPGQPRTMQFGAIAGVTRAQLDAAAATVHSEEAGEGLAEYISQRDFWVQYLEAQHTEAFTAAEQASWDGLEKLDDEREKLDDKQYVTRANQLAVDRNKARQDLILRLTREALTA